MYLDARGLVALWREALLAQAARAKALQDIRRPQAHPLFKIVPGPLEEWNGRARSAAK